MNPSIEKASPKRGGVKVVTGITFLLLSFFTANAQKLSDTISLKEVKVIGQKKLEEAGMMVTHIDTMVLQMVKTQTISELLSSYTPVFIKSYGRGSEATASFRGTAASHTQVYWNGLRVNSPMRGYVDFSLFPVYFIDDLSLQHGGSSLQSGSGALGGSILIENKPDWNNRLNVRAAQTVESFSTYKEFFSIGFGNSKVQLKTRLFTDKSSNDFPYYNYGVLPMHESVQKNAQYHKSGLLQEIYSRFGNQSVSAQLWAYQSNRNLPQLMSYEGESRKETQKDENLRAIVNWKMVKEKSKLEYIIGLNVNTLNYFRSSNESDFVNFDSKSSEDSYSSQLHYDWTPNENINFNWSAEANYSKVSSFDKAPQKKTGFNHDRLSFSLLNSAHVRVNPDWVMSFLFRSEWYDQQIIGFIPAFGMEYWIDEKQNKSFKLNLSRNYHQPGLNDLYWLPGGNPNLKPEDGLSGDLGYLDKASYGNMNFEGQLTTFASLIDNWIVWQPSASGAYYWEAANLQKVFARGAEIMLSTQYKAANGVLFNLKGNYSYTATSNMNALPSVDESRGKQLIYIPKHKANVFAETDFKDYYLKVNAPFTGKRYTTSNNVESDYEKVLNPYWLVNMTAGKKFEWKDLTADASLSVENLLDTDYMAILYRPMPGRYYSFTLQLQFRK
ncbi:MAG TPA: TonB-dependent receptor plug domain-containing protein [Prolixibacteraceae bacterium]|nr:TonB-dependent receptor plug domain-containing protein [Prolixibacteraceae bacterium]